MVLIALTGPVLPVGPAAAHAQLLDSDPADGAVFEAAPARVQLVFDEQVTLVAGSARLFTADGGSVVLQARSVDAVVTAPLPPVLPDGTYAVAYRVVSADGHPVSGAVTFRVGDSGPAQIQVPDADVAAATWTVRVATGLHLLAALLLAGLVGFHRLVHRVPGPPDRWTRRVLLGSLGLAVSAAAVVLGATAAAIGGAGPGTWLSAVRGEQVAMAALTVLAGAVALWTSIRRPAWPAVQLAAAGALALAPALDGHSRSTPPVPVTMLADGVHLLAGAFWLGGVVALVHALRTPHARRADLRNPSHAVVHRVTRFSTIAAGTVAALALAGGLMAVLILDDPAELLATGYGRTFLLKVGLVAVIVGVAWWNRRSLPGLIRARGSAGWLTLQRLIRYEAALLVVVVLITGALTTMSPRHQHTSTAPGTEVEVTGTSQGLHLTGAVAPAHTGQNTFTFSLTAHGEPITDGVMVRYRMPEAGLGPLQASAELDPDTGLWTTDLIWVAAGVWHLEVSARTSQFDEPIVVVQVPVQ